MVTAVFLLIFTHLRDFIFDQDINWDMLSKELKYLEIHRGNNSAYQNS